MYVVNAIKYNLEYNTNYVSVIVTNKCEKFTGIIVENIKI